MLEIGNYNLILTKDYEKYMDKYPGYSLTSGHIILSYLVDRYDDIGKNCLYLYREDKDTIRSIIKCKSLCFEQVTDLHLFLKDNLFRLDIIIVEAYNDIRKNEYLVSTIRGITDLPIILIGERAYNFTIVNFDNVYSIFRKFSKTNYIASKLNDYNDNAHIINLINNSEFTLSEFETMTIRDMKLESLLKKK